MESEPPVGVLKQMSPVEVCEPMRVRREVRWHPIENYADAVLVQVIHEIHEILGRAVTRGRREISRRLVSPGREKRMLHDRQQLNMRETHTLHVICEFGRNLPITEWPIVLLWYPHPRSHVHFID